jgi:hypothetical protein
MPPKPKIRERDKHHRQHMDERSSVLPAGDFNVGKTWDEKGK